MELLNSQPIRLFDGEPDTKRALLYATADPYQLSLQRVNVYSTRKNWCTSGDFSSGTGWSYLFTGSGLSITGGKFTGTSVGADQLINNYTLSVNRIYRITVVVDSISGGNLTVLNLGVISKAGTYTFYWKKTFDQDFKLQYGAGLTVTVDSVVINDVTDDFSHRVAVIDRSGNLEGFCSSTFNDGQMVFDVDINSIVSNVNDRYILHVYDPTVNNGAQNFVPNGKFSNGKTEDFRWTEVLGGTHSSAITQDGTDYEHEYVITIPDTGTSTLAQNTLFVGVEYNITFDLEFTGSESTLTVHAGTNNAAATMTTGSKSITLTCAGNTELKFTFARLATVGSETISISNVQVSKTTNSDYVADYKSVWFDYDTDSDCGSYLITCYRENPAFGLNFGTLFTPVIRVRSTLKNIEYEIESENYRTLEGRLSNYWFDRMRLDTYETDLEHHSVHDFMSLLGGFDSVYIGETEVVAHTSKYQFTPDEFIEHYGRGRFTVAVKTQNTIANEFDISVASITVGTGNNLVDPQGNFIVDPAGDNIVTP